jgi:serine/threonine-protein kinase
MYPTMRPYYKLATQLGILVLTIFFYACSKKDTANPLPVVNPTPTIVSTDYVEGAANSAMVITGTNFSTTVSDDVVFFNGTAATVTAATTTQLTVTVPANGSTGVITIKINGVSATGPVFTYLPALTIATANTLTGPFNTAVTITGTGFSKTLANDLVYFNGKPALVAVATTSQLTALVPLGAGTGTVSVKVDAGTVIGPVFTYQLSPVVSTFAGSGSNFYGDGTATTASFSLPSNLCIDASGNLYTADQTDNLIRKISPSGTVSTIAGSPGITGHANGTGSSATFFDPTSLFIDGAGNVYVTDRGNSVIRKITPDSIVTTFAGKIAITGATDGIDTLARFKFPYGITIDKSGTFYIADAGNNLIRKITQAGVVSTLAGNIAGGYADGQGASASFAFPDHITTDASGNIYVSDNGTMIRKITPSGMVTTLAGTPAQGYKDGSGAAASFNTLEGLAFGPDGNLYVADSKNNVIRKVTPTGIVTTFAGSGVVGSANGQGGSASFNQPSAIVFDSNGTMYVADRGNNVIRKIVMQ